MVTITVPQASWAFSDTNSLAITGGALVITQGGIAGQITVSGASTLSAGITATATTLTVASTASFSPTGTVLIDSELIPYTVTDATTLSLTRGSGATTHTSGTAVAQVLTLGPVSLAGSISAQINTLTTPVSLAGTELPAGPYFQLSGTALTLLLPGGNSLSGNFTVQRTTDQHGNTRLAIGASAVSLVLGGQTVLTGAQGLLVADAGSASGFAASLQGTVSLAGLLPSGVNLSGTFGVAINQSGAAVDETLTVGGQALSLTLPAGPYIQLSATGAQLTFGGQTLSGDFAYQQVGGVTQLSASNVSVSLGSGATQIVTLTGGHGLLTITGATTKTMTGSLSGTVARQRARRHGRRHARRDDRHRRRTLLGHRHRRDDDDPRPEPHRRSVGQPDRHQQRQDDDLHAVQPRHVGRQPDARPAHHRRRDGRQRAHLLARRPHRHAQRHRGDRRAADRRHLRERHLERDPDLGPDRTRPRCSSSSARWRSRSRSASSASR